MAGEKQSRRFLECTDDNCLIQVAEEMKRGDALQELIFTNEEELVGNVKVREALATLTMGWWSSRSWEKANSRLTTLNIGRANTGLFRDLLGRIPCETIRRREEEARRAVWFSSITFSRLKSGPYTCARSQAMVAEGLHGWKRSYWQNSKIEKETFKWWMRVRWGRRNIETLPKNAVIQLGKSKPAWSWIWSGIWRAAREVSKDTSAAKERLGKMCAHCWMSQKT